MTDNVNTNTTEQKISERLRYIRRLTVTYINFLPAYLPNENVPA